MSVFHSKAGRLHPYFREIVDGWEYHGNGCQDDLSNKDVRQMLKRKFWHHVKQLSGKVLMVTVEEELLPECASKSVVFTVKNYATKRGKPVNMPVATVKVTKSPNNPAAWSFKHQIIDKNLAEGFISLDVLKKTCEFTFGTLLVRDGNFLTESGTRAKLKSIINQA